MTLSCKHAIVCLSLHSQRTRWIRPDVNGVQLPDLDGFCFDVHICGIVEEEHAGGVVDGSCRVHARRDARPSALSKALHDGVVNLCVCIRSNEHAVRRTMSQLGVHLWPTQRYIHWLNIQHSVKTYQYSDRKILPIEHRDQASVYSLNQIVRFGCPSRNRKLTKYGKHLSSNLPKKLHTTQLSMHGDNMHSNIYT